METPKSIGGRPAHHANPTRRRLVELLAANGISQAEISRVLQIDPKTLRLRYRRELDKGAARLEAALAWRLYQIAGGDDDVALRAVEFVLRCKFGWSKYAPRPREAA